MDIATITHCKECGSTNIVHVEKKEQVICQDCGDIYEPTTQEFKKETGIVSKKKH